MTRIDKNEDRMLVLGTFFSHSLGNVFTHLLQGQRIWLYGNQESHLNSGRQAQHSSQTSYVVSSEVALHLRCPPTVDICAGQVFQYSKRR